MMEMMMMKRKPPPPPPQAVSHAHAFSALETVLAYVQEQPGIPMSAMSCGIVFLLKLEKKEEISIRSKPK